MKTSFLTTPRLSIDEVDSSDSAFILELVNTPGWIEFIGDRNIHSIAEAETYIRKLHSNPDIIYLVVTLQKGKRPIGIISFIKRPHLDHHDIGFAFLPAFNGSGYAFEAADAALKKFIHEGYSKILATTIPSNTKSIKLLGKLGLMFDKEILVDGKRVLVYKIER